MATENQPNPIDKIDPQEQLFAQLSEFLEKLEFSNGVMILMHPSSEQPLIFTYSDFYSGAKLATYGYRMFRDQINKDIMT